MDDSAGSTLTAPSTQQSDDALALAFTKKHGDELLYVHLWSTWLRWDGYCWQRDQTLQIFDLARKFCRQEACQAESRRDGRTQSTRVTSAPTIAAVERLARSDPRHARRPEQFDTDPWALNTPGGVVDLRTKETRANLPSDLFTKITSIAPSNTPCPRWNQFLEEITCGDQSMVRYLQRFIGYSLTGDVSEHAFAFLYGPGGNGKSVLLQTLAAMLGTYATTAMADAFTVGHHDQHPTSMASLEGARFVAVTETEEGRPWAEARIKSFTGGDRVSARVMRGDPREYKPQAKLWMAGNHLPTLLNPDPAMRRRLHLIQLTNVPSRPDPKLSELLRAELPGILQWAIDGCVMWQKQGLKPPPVVMEATDSYFESEDNVAAWVRERCENSPDAETSSTDLFTDFAVWSKGRGEHPGTQRRFSERLQRHASKRKTAKANVFDGIRLRPSRTNVK